MKNLRTFLFGVLVLLMAAGMMANTFAADGNVEYSGNSGDFIFSPGSSSSPTDIFPDFKNVMPGAELSQKITVKNNADNKVRVKIYLRYLGADLESYDLLSQLKLTVSKEGLTPFFDAAASEAGSLGDWTELGLLYSGGTVNLELKLSVPTSLGNEYQKKTAEMKWQFMAVEIPVDETKWVCPECHESHYRIIDYDDHSVYHCEKCDHTEEMLCEVCGGHMKKVIYKDETRKQWYYYQCVDNETHHTDPFPPTGDVSNIVLWSSLMSISAIGLFLLLFLKKRKEKRCDR